MHDKKVKVTSDPSHDVIFEEGRCTSFGDDREGPPVLTESLVSKQGIQLLPYHLEKENHVMDSLSGDSQKSRSSAFLPILLLDAPLLLILGIYCFLMWVAHVHNSYLLPQMKAVEWTEEWALREMTYYNRPCSKLDLSTTNKQDLFLPDTATPQDTYEHQLLHGFTVFPSVLSDETAVNLRNYIVSKNLKDTEADPTVIIAYENRHTTTFGLEEPSVSKAMMELTNNNYLKTSIEKIIGKNPALVEMAAITSSYNAMAQYWHPDLMSDASSVQCARAFGPSYSIFVMLQNTTKSMGATSVCLGTHMCSGRPLHDVCEEHGFQLVGQEGYYRAGNAVLMNMIRYVKMTYYIVELVYFVSDKRTSNQ